MLEVTLADRGRLTLPNDLREQYGDQYRIFEVQERMKLVPVTDNEDARE